MAPTSASTFAVPKTTAIVGGLFVAVAVVVCFALVALYHRRQKRLEASLERLHQSMYDRRAGVTFVNGEGDNNDDDGGGRDVAVNSAGRGRRNRNNNENANRRRGAGRPFSSSGVPRSADRVALLDDIGDENDDDHPSSGNDAAGNLAEAETYQPFQSFNADLHNNLAEDEDRNEDDLLGGRNGRCVSEEQMNNERNNALTNNNAVDSSSSSAAAAGRSRRNNDDDDALLLADDFDDGPVINAFAFNDEPPMIIA